MSPNPTDDLLVRDLYERVDRVLPTMALDPSGVLLASRRHRGRQTAVRSAAGVLAVGAFVVGATQIWADDPVTTPPAGVQQEPRPMGDGQTVELAPGVIAVNRPVKMTLDDGTPVLDLGIGFPNAPATSRPLILMPVTDDQLAEANASAEPHRVWDGGVQLAQVGESGPDVVSPWVWSSEETAGDEGFRWDTVMRTVGEESGLYIGVLPAWLPDPRVVLYSRDGFLQADGSRMHSLEVPVYPAPTDDGRLLYTVWIPAVADDVDGFATDVDATFAVGSDGTVVTGLGCATSTLDECAATFGPEINAAVDLALANDPQTSGVAGDTLSIQVAQDVHEVDSEEGRVVDLGIPVAGGDPLDEGRTYSLRAGVLVDGNAGTPDITGLWLDSLDPAGAPTTIAGSGGSGSRGGGGTVDEALTPANRNPIWMSMLGDHEACMVGVRPPALEGATFDLIIERDTGKQVAPIPTFRVPGLDADVWFVALTNPDVDIRDWPPTSIRVTYPDGKTTSWSVAGLAQSNP